MAYLGSPALGDKVRFGAPTPGPSPAGGGSDVRLPHLKSVPPHFTFGPLVAAYTQYSILKMWPPLLVFGPSFWFLALLAAKSWRRACPTQLVHDSRDAKSELGVNGRRKRTRAPHIVLSGPVWKLYVIATSQNWRQDLWILQIITMVELRVESFCVKLLSLWNFGHDWTFKLLYYDTPNCGIRWNCSN